MKFPKDPQKKVLERVKLAWQNVPQQVHQGYAELEKKLFVLFASKYPTFVPEKMPPSGQCAGESCREPTDAGSLDYTLKLHSELGSVDVCG